MRLSEMTRLSATPRETKQSEKSITMTCKPVCDGIESQLMHCGVTSESGQHPKMPDHLIEGN